MGLIRPVYFVILVSHVVLSAVVAAADLHQPSSFSLSGRFPQHKAGLALHVSRCGSYVSVHGASSCSRSLRAPTVVRA